MPETHSELAERGRKICNCRQCVEPEKHPCNRVICAASIAKQVLEETKPRKRPSKKKPGRSPTPRALADKWKNGRTG